MLTVPSTDRLMPSCRDSPFESKIMLPLKSSCCKGAVSFRERARGSRTHILVVDFAQSAQVDVKRGHEDRSRASDTARGARCESRVGVEGGSDRGSSCSRQLSEC